MKRFINGKRNRRLAALLLMLALGLETLLPGGIALIRAEEASPSQSVVLEPSMPAPSAEETPVSGSQVLEAKASEGTAEDATTPDTQPSDYEADAGVTPAADLEDGFIGPVYPGTEGPSVGGAPEENQLIPMGKETSKLGLNSNYRFNPELFLNPNEFIEKNKRKYPEYNKYDFESDKGNEYNGVKVVDDWIDNTDPYRFIRHRLAVTNKNAEACQREFMGEVQIEWPRPRTKLDVVFVLDTSGSFSSHRLKIYNALAKMLNSLDFSPDLAGFYGDRVMIVPFGGEDYEHLHYNNGKYYGIEQVKSLQTAPLTAQNRRYRQDFAEYSHYLYDRSTPVGIYNDALDVFYLFANFVKNARYEGVTPTTDGLVNAVNYYHNEIAHYRNRYSKLGKMDFYHPDASAYLTMDFGTGKSYSRKRETIYVLLTDGAANTATPRLLDEPALAAINNYNPYPHDPKASMRRVYYGNSNYYDSNLIYDSGSNQWRNKEIYEDFSYRFRLKPYRKVKDTYIAARYHPYGYGFYWDPWNPLDWYKARWNPYPAVQGSDGYWYVLYYSEAFDMLQDFLVRTAEKIKRDGGMIKAWNWWKKEPDRPDSYVNDFPNANKNIPFKDFDPAKLMIGFWEGGGLKTEYPFGSWDAMRSKVLENFEQMANAGFITAREGEDGDVQDFLDKFQYSFRKQVDARKFENIRLFTYGAPDLEYATDSKKPIVDFTDVELYYSDYKKFERNTIGEKDLTKLGYEKIELPQLGSKTRLGIKELIIDMSKMKPGNYIVRYKVREPVPPNADYSPVGLSTYFEGNEMVHNPLDGQITQAPDIWKALGRREEPNVRPMVMEANDMNCIPIEIRKFVTDEDLWKEYTANPFFEPPRLHRYLTQSKEEEFYFSSQVTFNERVTNTALDKLEFVDELDPRFEPIKAWMLPGFIEKDQKLVEDTSSTLTGMLPLEERILGSAKGLTSDKHVQIETFQDGDQERYRVKYTFPELKGEKTKGKYAGYDGKSYRLVIRTRLRESMPPQEYEKLIGTGIPNQAKLMLNNLPVISNTVEVVPHGTMPIVIKDLYGEGDEPKYHKPTKEQPYEMNGRDQFINYRVQVPFKDVSHYSFVELKDVFDPRLASLDKIEYSAYLTDDVEPDTDRSYRPDHKWTSKIELLYDVDKMVAGYRLKTKIPQEIEELKNKNLVIKFKLKLKKKLPSEDANGNISELIPNHAKLTINELPIKSNEVWIHINTNTQEYKLSLEKQILKGKRKSRFAKDDSATFSLMKVVGLKDKLEVNQDAKKIKLIPEYNDPADILVEDNIVFDHNNNGKKEFGPYKAGDTYYFVETAVTGKRMTLLEQTVPEEGQLLPGTPELENGKPKLTYSFVAQNKKKPDDPPPTDPYFPPPSDPYDPPPTDPADPSDPSGSDPTNPSGSKPTTPGDPSDPKDPGVPKTGEENRADTVLPIAAILAITALGMALVKRRGRREHPAGRR